MYCSRCGIEFDKDDNFCSQCGSAARRFRVFRKASLLSDLGRQKKGGMKSNHYVVPGITLFIILVFIWGIKKKILDNKDILLDSISIAQSSSFENTGDAVLKGCEKCERVDLVIDGKTTSFPLARPVKNPESLRGYLIELTKSNNDKESVLTIFDEDERNRVFDISLDISGSVVEKDKRDQENGSSSLYSDALFDKLNKVLRGTEGLLPGDDIIVRLYGPDFVENPCKQSLSMKYLGPAWKAKFLYSLRTHQGLIELSDHISVNKQNRGQFQTSEIDKVEEKIKVFYKEALANPNRLCHTDTLMDHQLAKIMEDSALNAYNTRHYVLINDGAFSFDNSYITKTSYDILSTHDQKPFTRGDKVLCRSSKDTFTLIGLDFGNDFRYRDAVEGFFKSILRSCILQFENI